MLSLKSWQKAGVSPQWGVILALTLMALLRLIDITRYPLEWDEANLLAIAQLPTIPEVIRVAIIRDFHPPGTALLLHFWVQLFGNGDTAVHLFTWFWGNVGLVVTYLLACHISQSRKIGLLTAGLCVFSPFLWHYTHITTFYSPHYALVLGSWYLFLRLIQAPPTRFWRSPMSWGYLFITLFAMYAMANAAIFLPFQGLYLWIQRKQLPFSLLKNGFISGGVLCLLYLPYLWAVAQPWHIFHTVEWPGHQAPSFVMFLYTPINLLFLGYDTRDFHILPKIGILTLYGLAGFTLLAACLRRKVPLLLLSCIGFFPPLCLYIFSQVFDTGLFQYRTILYSLFALHFLIASFLDRLKPAPAVLLCTCLLLTQTVLPFKRPYWPDTGSVLAANVKAGYQPGDGILIYPGWMSLVFMRYFAPEDFGLSAHERQFDPNQENYFNMAHRIDDTYFIVSGVETLKRPDIQAALDQFETAHPRIWMVAESEPTLLGQLDCLSEYMMLQPDGQFVPTRCRLTGTDSP